MKTPTSPKVTSGAVWSLITTLLLSLVNSATPDSLAVFGKYEPLVSGVLAIAAFAAGAYLKEDPLRTAGAQKLAEDAKAVAPDVSPEDIQRLLDALGARLEQPAPEPKTVPVTVTPQPGA